MSILLVDATNNFLRNWTVVPTINSNGVANGGVVGFLRSLGYFVNLSQPSKVILVWDGPGGSKRRKAIKEEYKGNRSPPRINREYDFSADNPEQNKIDQRLRLGQYLKDLPVIEITIPDIEADDVIAYLSAYYSDDDIVIASGDKDFYQLITDRIKIFSPTAKEFIDIDSVYRRYTIYPNNFCLARAVIGDKSDNLKGVKGIGEKKLLKFFPCFSEKNTINLQYFFELCEQNLEKYKLFLDYKDIIIDNHKVMQLASPIISATSVQRIGLALRQNIKFSSTIFRLKLLEDGIDQLSQLFFHSFRTLTVKGN